LIETEVRKDTKVRTFKLSPYPLIRSLNEQGPSIKAKAQRQGLEGGLGEWEME